MQAHRGLRPHHLRVRLPLPQGLSPRGPGGRRRRGGFPAQVRIEIRLADAMLVGEKRIIYF